MQVHEISYKLNKQHSIAEIELKLVAIELQ